MEKIGLNNILKTSVYASLFVQSVTLILDLYVYFLPVAGELSIVKKMLELEIFVQLIEGSFYVWFASIFSHVKNVTPHRYYDWAITTPTMLFTFCLYLDYLGERDKSKENAKYSGAPLGVEGIRGNSRLTLVERSSSEFMDPLLRNMEEQQDNRDTYKKQSVKNTTLLEYLKHNFGVLLPIFFLNLMMLLFGYLGEIGELDNKLAVLCGFLPFITYFIIIYEKFAKYSSFYGKVVFFIFFAIWSLYGLAALGSYYWKNIAYNILDLFAKNFFGIILAYTLYNHMA